MEDCGVGRFCGAAGDFPETGKGSFCGGALDEEEAWAGGGGQVGGGEDEACDGEGGVLGVLGVEFGEGDGVVVELGGNVDLDGGWGHCGEGEEDLFFFLELRDTCRGRFAEGGTQEEDICVGRQPTVVLKSQCLSGLPEVVHNLKILSSHRRGFCLSRSQSEARHIGDVSRSTANHVKDSFQLPGFQLFSKALLHFSPPPFSSFHPHRTNQATVIAYSSSLPSSTNLILPFFTLSLHASTSKCLLQPRPPSSLNLRNP